MHVGNLTATKTLKPKNWTTTVTVTIHDASHAPLSGVVVNFTWSGGYSASGSCTTGTNGACSAKSGAIANNGIVTYAVTNLTRANYTYAAASNHVTSITVSR
jgi:serine protease AprX